MKNILLILLAFFLSNKLFSQIKPTNPVSVPQMTWYKDINGHMWAYRGSSLGYIQMVDSSQISSHGSVTSITPGIGFTSHVPITTSGTLNVDTALIGSAFAKLTGGNVLLGNQTISNANLYITGINHGLTLDAGSFAYNSEQLVTYLAKRNGWAVIGANGQQIARFSNESPGTDQGYTSIDSKLSLKTMININDYGSAYDLLARVSSAAGGDEGLIGKIPATIFATSTANNLKADSARIYNGSQNIYRNVTGSYVRKISYALGDSYTVGVGASNTKFNYITQYANMSGDSIVNLGISSSTLLYYPPYDPAGVLSLDETYATNIPTYNSATMNVLFIAYGFNDHRVSYPVDTFKTHYNAIINYAKSTKGWPAQSIVLVSPWYMPPTAYVSLFGQPIPNETQKLAYVAAVQSLSSTQGTKYADTYNLIKGGIKRLGMNADSIHGNNTNYALVGKYLNGIVRYTINQNGQRLAVQGLTELSSLKLSTDDTLKTTNFTPVAADSTGRIRKAPNAYILANPADAQGANINVSGDVQGTRMYVAQTPPIRGSSVYGAEFNVPVRVNAIYATGSFVAPPGNAISMFVTSGEGYLTSYNADSAKYNTLRINPGNTGTNSSLGQVIIGTGDVRFVKGTVKVGISGNSLATGQFVGSQGLLATGTGTNFGNGASLQYTGGNGYLYVQGGGAILMQHSNQGGVQIGSSSDIASAMLGIRSTTKGFSPPIMTSTQFGSIASKANGLMGWATDMATYTVYNSVNVRNVVLSNSALPTSGTSLVGNGTDWTITTPTGTGTPVFSISPTFTGVPLSTTAASGTNTTQIATTAFVQTATQDVVNTATDANYTITSANQLVKLPVVTANRTVSIPTAASYTGRILRIWNQNTSGTFSWSFTGATVKDAANNTLTNLVNTSVYILESDGSVWIKQN